MTERLIAHLLAHPFGIAGLIFNTAGAIGLLKFTADPDAGSPLTHEQLQSLRSADPALRRPYVRLTRGYQVSLAALLLGFALQLIDLLFA